MSARGLLARTMGELGAVGLAALAVIAGALVFATLGLRPLEARDAQLDRELARLARHSSRSGSSDAASADAKLESFYKLLDTGRAPTDWLAALYGIGKAMGLDLGSADYRLQPSGERIERYEISLPLAGSYSQIRAFAKNALLDIPVLSLDQVSIRRERASDGLARAEFRLTLYLLKP